MPYENIYIKQVAEHPHIYSDEELMRAKKGKWLDFFAEQKRMKNEGNVSVILDKGGVRRTRSGIQEDKLREASIINNRENISGMDPRIKSEDDGLRLMLEIGTGMGNFFSNYAANRPEMACVGIELKYKRLIRTYEKCARKGRGDVVLLKVFGQRITEIFAEGEVDELYLLFSDPWPKKKHYHNRVIQDDFLCDAASILAPDGIFLIKTDEASYAEWIDEHLARSPYFTYEKNENEDPDKKLTPENATEFETMGRREGSRIVSFTCRKIKN